MKKLLFSLFLVVMLCWSNSINAQKIVEVGNQWNIITIAAFAAGASYSSLKIGEDTLINGISYSKLLRKVDSETSFLTSSYLREDSLDRVYLLDLDRESEYLIYDFRLMVNDTFGYPYCKIEVTSIDTIITEDQVARKRYTVKRSSPYFEKEDYWIEGIGSLRHLSNHMFTHCFADYDPYLLCFYKNGELVLSNDEENDCANILLAEHTLYSEDVSVYPNPFTDEIVIELDKPLLEEIDIELYSFQGKKLFVQEQINSIGNIRINSNDLIPGPYFIAIKSNEKIIFSTKVVKH